MCWFSGFYENSNGASGRNKFTTDITLIWHKRILCLAYQTIATPDGIIFSLYDPEVGRWHDLTVLKKSGLSDDLKNYLKFSGEQFYIFGDKAYVLRNWLQVFFDSFTATTEQKIFNTEMSGIREGMEWSYKDPKQMWTRNDFARFLKVHQAPIYLIFIALTVGLNLKKLAKKMAGTLVCT